MNRLNISSHTVESFLCHWFSLYADHFSKFNNHQLFSPDIKNFQMGSESICFMISEILKPMIIKSVFICIICNDMKFYILFQDLISNLFILLSTDICVHFIFWFLWNIASINIFGDVFWWIYVSIFLGFTSQEWDSCGSLCRCAFSFGIYCQKFLKWLDQVFSH